MAEYSETEFEELSDTQLCDRDTQSEEWETCYVPTCGKYCIVPEKSKYDIGSQEPERNRRRKAKSLQQHYPCHCCLDVTKHSAKSKNFDNMEAFVKNYENFMLDPMNKSLKKLQNSLAWSRSRVCSHATADAYHHPRKRQTSGHRYQEKNEQNQAFSTITENIARPRTNNNHETCRERLRSTKDGYKKDGHWKDYQIEETAGTLRNCNMDDKVPMKYTSCRKEHVPKSEPRFFRQNGKMTNKLATNLKNDSLENENNDYWRKFDQDDPNFTKSGLNELRYEMQKNMNVEKAKGKPNNTLPSKVSTVRSGSANVTDSQTLSKSKTIEDSTSHKALTIDASEDSKKSETKNISICKPSKQSIVQQSSACRPDDVWTTLREDTHCEVIVKDEEQEVANRQNIYAGGDLDLHATKNHILGLIDRALCNEFGNAADQEKNTDSNRMLTLHEIYIEITRALQGDCCPMFAEDVLNNMNIRLLKNKYTRHLKMLYYLEKILDNCSPRLASSTSRSRPAAVEQPLEERQQPQPQPQPQHDDKQSLSTIP